jgi:hypothetical protein
MVACKEDILEIEAARTLSDTAGSKASTRAVRCASVKRRTDECNVKLCVARQTRVVGETTKCRNAREDGVGLR